MHIRAILVFLEIYIKDPIYKTNYLDSNYRAKIILLFLFFLFIVSSIKRIINLHESYELTICRVFIISAFKKFF